MRRRFMLTAAAAAAAMLTTSGPAGASTAAAGQAVPGGSGAQLWVARYNGPANGFDAARSVAVGPGGGRVFVTGDSFGRGTGDDYATVAYSAVTGRRLWVARYNGPGNGLDMASSVVVSRDGTKVFVTGHSQGRGTGVDYATVAYSAATGRQLWVARYNGPGNSDDAALSLAVAPGGARVFVTGSSQGRGTGDDYATVAYSAATGRQLWVARYNGPRNLADVANSVAVGPGGGRVFVTGSSEAQVFSQDYATVAYDAATGRQLWVRRYNGPGNSGDIARSVAVSPGGTRVFVTGESYGRTTSGDYATVAYDAATGRQLWVARYNGPANDFDSAGIVAVSPGGTRVFVTGDSPGPTTSEDYATVAYDAATGRQLWVARYNGPANSGDAALSLAVGPGGARLSVTGLSDGRTTGSDYATVAYSAATGTQLWVARYNGPGNGHDVASCVAVGPGGARVFVTGESPGRTSDFDYATVAYRG